MDKHRKLVDVCRIPLFLNSAACALKLKKPDQVIEFCTNALKYESNNAKALFRRSQAHVLQGNPEKAKEDLKQAVKQKPKDVSIRTELAKVNAILKEENKNYKDFWR